jgi:hypothetical protein
MITERIYPILIHIHSGIRWILLASLIISVLISLINSLKKSDLSKYGKLFSLITLISANIQLIAGLVLYIISPKVVFSAESMASPILRFYLVEHISAMVLAIILITVGYTAAKKKMGSIAAAKRIFWYYFFALILLLALIPWPWMSYGSQWF